MVMVILGVVDISVPGQSLALDSIALSASLQLPTQVPFNLDYNSGDTIGFSKSLYSPLG